MSEQEESERLVELPQRIESISTFLSAAFEHILSVGQSLTLTFKIGANVVTVIVNVLERSDEDEPVLELVTEAGADSAVTIGTFSVLEGGFTTGLAAGLSYGIGALGITSAAALTAATAGGLVVWGVGTVLILNFSDELGDLTGEAASLLIDDAQNGFKYTRLLYDLAQDSLESGETPSVISTISKIKEWVIDPDGESHELERTLSWENLTPEGLVDEGSRVVISNSDGQELANYFFTKSSQLLNGEPSQAELNALIGQGFLLAKGTLAEDATSHEVITRKNSDGHYEITKQDGLLTVLVKPDGSAIDLSQFDGQDIRLQKVETPFGQEMKDLFAIVDQDGLLKQWVAIVSDDLENFGELEQFDFVHNQGQTFDFDLSKVELDSSFGDIDRFTQGLREYWNEQTLSSGQDDLVVLDEDQRFYVPIDDNTEGEYVDLKGSDFDPQSGALDWSDFDKYSFKNNESFDDFSQSFKDSGFQDFNFVRQGEINLENDQAFESDDIDFLTLDFDSQGVYELSGKESGAYRIGRLSSGQSLSIDASSSEASVFLSTNSQGTIFIETPTGPYVVQIGELEGSDINIVFSDGQSIQISGEATFSESKEKFFDLSLEEYQNSAQVSSGKVAIHEDDEVSVEFNQDGDLATANFNVNDVLGSLKNSSKFTLNPTSQLSAVFESMQMAFDAVQNAAGNEFLKDRAPVEINGQEFILLGNAEKINLPQVGALSDNAYSLSGFGTGKLSLGVEIPEFSADINPQDVLQDFPWENLDLDSLRIIDDAGELLEFQIEDNFEAIFTGASDEAVLSKAGELGFVNSAPVNTRDLSFGFVDADSDGAYVFGTSPGSIGAIESLADGQRVVVAVSVDVLNLELSSSNQGFILIETALGKQVIYIEEMTGASFELELPGGNVITVQRDDLFDSSKEGSPILRSGAYAQENSVADRVFVNTQDRIFFETPEFNDGPRDYVSIGAADWLNLPRDFVDGNLDNYQLAPIELFDSYTLGSGLDFTGLLDLGDNEYLSSRSAQSSLGKDYFWVRPTDSLALGSMQGLGDFSLSNLSGRADLTVQVADPALDVWTLFEQSSFVQDQSASIGSLSLQGLAGEDLGSLEFQLGDNIQLLQLRFGDDIVLDPETFRILQNDDGTFTTVLQEGAELTVSSGETVLAQDLIDHTKQEATNVADFLFQELSSVFSKLQDVIFGSEDEVVEPGELSQFEQLQGEILGRLLLGESLDEIVEAVGNRLAGDLAAELVAVPLLNTLNIDPQSFAHGVAKASVAGFAVNVLQGEENLGEAAGDAVVTAAVTRALAKVNYGLNEGASSGIGDSGNSGLGESGNAAIAAAVTTLVLSLSKGGLGSENLEHSYKAAVSAAASQYVAHLVAVSLTPLFGPLGYAVGYAVGQALGDVVGVPVYNYVGNKLDAGKEVYDAFEDLLTGKDGFGQFAKDFGKALDDLLINAPKEFIQDLGKGIIDKFLGGYSKQSSTNTVALRTEVIAGGNSRIIGVRAEGALLQASQSGDDEILGTNGADVIVGRDGANVAAGFGGDDKVINLWLNFQQDVVFLKAA